MKTICRHFYLEKRCVVDRFLSFKLIIINCKKKEEKKAEPSGDVLQKKERNCELLFILFICLPHKRSNNTVHNVKVT